MQAFPLARATLEPSYTYDDGREEACVVRLGTSSHDPLIGSLTRLFFSCALADPASWRGDDDVQRAAV